MKLPAFLLAGLASSTVVVAQARGMMDGPSLEVANAQSITAPRAADTTLAAASNGTLKLDTQTPVADAGAPKPKPQPQPRPVDPCPPCGRG